MINEVLEVQDYLNGNNIDKKCLYRICFLLAKWYKEQGLSKLEIRQKIFNWGKQYNIYINQNVNSIINQALNDKQRLRDNIVIKINTKDIDEIKARFDTKNTRLTALALLCYFKAYGDRDKEISISLSNLANWIKLSNTNVSGIYLKELVDFEYIEKSNTDVFKWNNKICNKQLHLKLCVSFNNTGDYILEGNDIIGLYSKIF